LPTQQHQALLVIRAAPKGSVVSVGMIAEELLIAPHTAAELVGRLESAGLVSRAVDRTDARRVAISLRPKATKILSKLSRAHLDEIRQLVPRLISTLQRISGEEKSRR
jgi:DNA-binding MarR family transcriptional regulator